MNIALTRAADGLPRRAFTVHDIRRMVEAGFIAENEPFELIGGDLVMMAAKGYAHELIKSALNVAIARALPDGMSMGAEMTVQLADATLLDPDLVVFERSALVRSEANFSYISPGGLMLAIELMLMTLPPPGPKYFIASRDASRTPRTLMLNSRWNSSSVTCSSGAKP